ncbi:hypothetical protein Dimus_038268 [Dionaea muscipula]
MAASAASNSNTTVNSATETQALKRSSNDVGWEYGLLVDPTNLDKVLCKLCNKRISGGVYRLKQHIAHVKGNVAACSKSSLEDKDKCMKALMEAKDKKKEKKKEDKERRDEVRILEEEEFENDEVEVVGSKKRPRFLGPMDKFASGIDPETKIVTTRQQNINDALWKERTHKVHLWLARWVYENGIPFYAIENDAFRQFCEAVGQFGMGYRPPSQYQLREPLLKEEVERTKRSLKKHEEEWALTGCSIMTDAWTDRKRRSIMNLCVNCRHGTTFVASKEDSEESHTGQYIFNYVDKFVDDIGSQNVIQVVTDNASNNMVAGDLLKEKRPTTNH